MNVDIMENQSEPVVKKQTDDSPDKESEIEQVKAIVVWRKPIWENQLFDLVQGNKVGAPVPQGVEKVSDPSMDSVDIAVDTLMDGLENLEIQDIVQKFDEPVEKINEPVADKACEMVSDVAENLHEPAENRVEVIVISDEEDPEAVKVHHYRTL